MNIMLANKKLNEIVKAEYLENIQKFLDNNGFTHMANTSQIGSKAGNYHIFDIQNLMDICGEEKMREFITFLQENDYVGKAFIGTVGLTYTNLNPKEVGSNE